jgi:hypothetical protein
VAFDGGGAPRRAEPGGDGILVSVQSGDERPKRGLIGSKGGLLGDVADTGLISKTP